VVYNKGGQKMKSKMVKMKRLLAVTLATAMTVSMAGCGNAKTNAPADDSKATVENTDASSEEASTASTTEEDLGGYSIRTDANGNKIDLGGIEVIVRDWWSTGEREEAADAYTEARYEYLDWAQETYNFTIKELAISDWGSTPEDFANYVSTNGDDNYYVFALRTGDELIAAMNSGLMYDLATLDCLDFSEDKWVHAITDQYSKGSSTYAFRSHTGAALGGRGVYFNKRILQEAGIDPQKLYDWQESGEWTWDKFEEICSQVEADTDNDGVIDRFAMACYNTVWYTMAVYSNFGDFIAKDDAGKYYNDLESNETMEALTWAVDMWDKYDASKAYPEDAAWDYWTTAYTNGEACFCSAELWRSGSFNDAMEDDFGFVCFPKGPQANDYANVCSDNPYAIPACYDAEKAWKVAFAYDIYTEPVPGYEDYEPWKSGFYQSFRDAEAVDLTVSRLMKNGRPAYDALVPGVNTSDVIWAINKENTPAQQAEVVRPTWAAFLEEANK